MLTIGPWSAALFAVPLALVVALLAGRWLAASDPDAQRAVAPLLVDGLAVGLLSARIGFIVAWWPQYAQEPVAMLRIGDGGFLAWVGIPCALAFVLWRLRRRAPLRRPIGGALLAGAASWAIAIGVLALLRGTPAMLPEVELRALDGSPVALSQFAGRPLVVNLWATWCPPCRREMPVLADAQRQRPDITFVFANQGESAGDVQRYLDDAPFALDGVLLDGFSTIAREVGSRGLPTTLFFDADGRLVDSHIGELTRASLADRLQRVAPPARDRASRAAAEPVER